MNVHTTYLLAQDIAPFHICTNEMSFATERNMSMLAIVKTNLISHAIIHRSQDHIKSQAPYICNYPLLIGVYD